MRTTAAICIAAVVAGCAAVRDAHEAQSAAAPRAAGERRSAAPSPDVGSSLEKMVAFALANRPSMMSASLAVKDARLAMKEIASDAPLAGMTPWNAFDVNGNVGHSESSRSAHFDKLKKKTYGNAAAALSVDVLLWDFGRNDARARAQAERLVAAELELTKAGYAVFEEVATAYFERLQAAALLDVAFTNQQMYSQHLMQAQERLAAGEAQKLDVLKSRLDLAEAMEKVVAATNSYINAGAVLASALGLEADSAKSPLFPLPDFKGYVRAFDVTTQSSTELFAFARTNSPSVQVARARLRAASHDVDYAVADLLPKATGSLSLNWSDPLWYWRWGFNAAQNLFSGFRNTTAIDRAVVAMDAAVAALDDAELGLSLSLELATEERDNAREALATAEASVQSARENLDTVTEQFSIGDVSRVEYTDAVAAYSSALANREKAFYRGQIAEAKLFSLIGVWPVFRENNVEM